jgi:probable rRNA maturation factor
VERFARKLQKELAKGRPFDTLITGDAELRRLNREFRGKDYPTDVLSFPSEPRPSEVVKKSAHGKLKLTPTNASCWSATVGHALACQRPLAGAFFLSSSGSGPHLGDIAISLGRARAQAREFGHPIETELEILMLHGVLHLCGHDHETDSGAMARAEKRWRAKLGLPTGLIERVRA